jgi:rhamnosyltransferase
VFVTRELTAWFGSLAPSNEPVVDRLAPDERAVPAEALLGRRGYFTDANGCVRRSAWERVPFRDVPYAEDHALAHDMLRAGYAKAFVPGAAVVHSHDYDRAQLARRAFDESRAMAAVYGWRMPLRALPRELWGSVGADRRFALATGRVRAGGQFRLLTASTVHHLARSCGTALGARADRLPDGLVRRLSLERHVP